MADAPGPSALLDLVGVFSRLRAECAWKAAQTHQSLTRYLIEECYETVEAVDAGDPDWLCEELGDVLLQVYLHAAIAEEAGEFTIGDVAAGLHEKMVRRNPHVFGPPGQESPRDPESVDQLWQRIKATEKQRDDLMDGVPEALPALLRADKLLERAERAGAPLEIPADAEDLGDRLMLLVAEARRAGADPEAALRDAVRRHQRDA